MAEREIVVNRTTGRRKRTLIATFDGEQYSLPPGETVLDARVVPYALRQNPVLGSMDPHDPIRTVQYLLGVKGKEKKYPCTPIVEDPDAIELIDRSKMPGVAHRVQGRAATAWELHEDNPRVDGAAAAGGD